MEFDEINALINIEREKFQHDIKHGIINLSSSIKQTKQQIKAQQAERAAMDRVKQLTRQAHVALMQLNTAMADHAKKLKNAAAASTI